MAWPGLNDLQDALQDPARAFKDQTLSRGRVEQNRLGLPISWIGNFAAVFKVVVNGNPHAVRCFTHNPLGKQNRYEAIDQHLKTNGRPATFVDFNYQETGLICRDQEYPLIKMPWINGQTLDEFTYKNIDKADVLEQLAREWYQTATELQRLPIAHNDLQHGNVMVEQGSRASIKLVDYDGLYVPHFANQQSPEKGHRHYQHPRRDQSHYGPDVDNFPALVIYTSLIALARDPGAKARRATDESLLFAETDLQEPQNSPLFKYLEQSSNQQTAQLARALSSAAKGKVENTPTLEQVSGQTANKALPSWLTEPMPLDTAAVHAATAVVAPQPTPPQPASTPTAPIRTYGDNTENKAEIQKNIDWMQEDLKKLIITYAEKLERTGRWSINDLPKDEDGHPIPTIRSIKTINGIRHKSDSLSLLHCLSSISEKLDETWARNNSLSECLVEKVIGFRNGSQHYLYLCNDQYTTRAIQAIKKLHDGIKSAPQHLPDQAISTGANQNQAISTSANQNQAISTGANQNQAISTSANQNQAISTGANQNQGTNPGTQPTSSNSTWTLALEHLPAIALLLSTVLTVVLFGLTATPRISIQDWIMIMIGSGLAMIGSACWLWKTKDRPVDLLLHDLTITGSSFWNVIERAIRAIRQIQNRGAKWIVSIILTIIVIAMVSGTSIYLSRPNITTISPDPNTASPAEAPTSMQTPNKPEDLSHLSNAVTNIPLENTSQDQQLSSLATEYAHCNGTYSNQEAEARAQAINQAIASSTTNIDEIRRFVREECPPIPVNNDPTEQPTPQPTTTRAYSPQTIQAVLPSTDQPSTQNPVAITPVEIPTLTPTPSPTPSPYHLSTSLKPIHVQELDADGGLLSSQNYEIAACYYDPHDTEHPRKWKLFTQPDQSLLEPVFAIHFNEPINLQHGLCYDFKREFLGPHRMARMRVSALRWKLRTQQLRFPLGTRNTCVPR